MLFLRELRCDGEHRSYPLPDGILFSLAATNFHLHHDSSCSAGKPSSWARMHLPLTRLTAS